MAHTLPDARAAFVAATRRDAPGTDFPRYVAVLDALIKWSLARPKLLEFRPATTRTDVIRFGLVGSPAIVWSAQVTRGSGPSLEIDKPSGTPLTPEQRALVLKTLNAHKREQSKEGDRLRISFAALKNTAASAAVLSLMQELLTGNTTMKESMAESKA
jgi:hypothetical protein